MTKSSSSFRLEAFLCIALSLSIVPRAVSKLSGQGVHARSQVSWEVRSEHLDSLLKHNIAEDPHSKIELTRMLEKENQLIESTLRNSGEKVSVSDKYGERYGEYYERLLEAFVTVANYSNLRDLRLLAQSSYGSQSKIAQSIAARGDVIVPVFLEMANSDLSVKRADAVAMLRTLLLTNDLRSASERQRVLEAVRVRVSDSSPMVRQEAVRTLGAIGDESWVPLLERVAASDASHSGELYPVRAEATRAIIAIRARIKK